MFIWPFRTKDQAQFKRIDQGWDLQGLGPGEEDVLAIADGHVVYEHDPGTNGGHFGDPYVMQSLDQSVALAGRSYSACYYGHARPVVPAGFYAIQGTRIAITTSPGGGGAPDHWLEIGFWGPHGPVGVGTGWTQAGQDMHDLLESAPVFEEDDMYSEQDRTRDNQVHDAISDVQSRVGNVVEPKVVSIADELGKLLADFEAYVKAHP